MWGSATPTATIATGGRDRAKEKVTTPLFVCLGVRVHLCVYLQVRHALEMASLNNCCLNCGDLPSANHELFYALRGQDVALCVPGTPVVPGHCEGKGLGLGEGPRYLFSQGGGSVFEEGGYDANPLKKKYGCSWG